MKDLINSGVSAAEAARLAVAGAARGTPPERRRPVADLGAG